MDHLIWPIWCFFLSSSYFFRGNFERRLGDAISIWAILLLFWLFHLFRLISTISLKILPIFWKIAEILCLRYFIFSSRLLFFWRFICRLSLLCIWSLQPILQKVKFVWKCRILFLQNCQLCIQLPSSRFQHLHIYCNVSLACIIIFLLKLEPIFID